MLPPKAPLGAMGEVAFVPNICRLFNLCRPQLVVVHSCKTVSEQMTAACLVSELCGVLPGYVRPVSID